MIRRKQTMPFRDAMALADDDLSDGAFWAMAHEIAGLEYGEGFSELVDDEPATVRTYKPRSLPCAKCGRKFRTAEAVSQHERDAHKTGPTP